MNGHWILDPENAPMRCTKANTQFGILPSDQVVTVATNAFECTDAHHRITTAGVDLARWPLPIFITKPIIYRFFRVTFASPSAHNTDVCVRTKEGIRTYQPILF
jgi:hypothetical protein